ncbi:hypothetical protein WA026_015237 [Henosepilachna vigintioctopunctata]|uniref:Uncharacterized protein n=1 Tax=Henosepilachna vigintioctopunctata TaxID=420089 RepID=A0AAW1TKV3_9CUCU
MSLIKDKIDGIQKQRYNRIRENHLIKLVEFLKLTYKSTAITENCSSSKKASNMKLIILAFLIVGANCLPQRNYNVRSKLGRAISNQHEEEPFDVDAEPNSIPVPTSGRFTGISERKPTELELEQNRNAHYKFSTNIDDKISDQTQQRTEVRDGLKVEGSYSYSDGYYKRTYHYVADDKGYRIVSSEVVPLDGPQVNLEGTASVDSAAHGTKVSYRVQSIPAVGPKIVDQIQE